MAALTDQIALTRDRASARKKPGGLGDSLFRAASYGAALLVLFVLAGILASIAYGAWPAYNEFGFLSYSFVETVEAMHPYYIIRALGGALFLIGALIMAYNLWRTARGDLKAEAGLPVLAPVAAE